MIADKALPKRVLVSQVLAGRYAPGSRPVSWNDRKEGIESIITSEGDTIQLFSNGGQSTPSKNWELLLTKADRSSPDPTFSWTLYGVKRSN